MENDNEKQEQCTIQNVIWRCNEDVYNEYVEYAKSLNYPVHNLVKSKF